MIKPSYLQITIHWLVKNYDLGTSLPLDWSFKLDKPKTYSGKVDNLSLKRVQLSTWVSYSKYSSCAPILYMTSQIVCTLKWRLRRSLKFYTGKHYLISCQSKITITTRKPDLRTGIQKVYCLKGVSPWRDIVYRDLSLSVWKLPSRCNFSSEGLRYICHIILPIAFPQH